MRIFSPQPKSRLIYTKCILVHKVKNIDSVHLYICLWFVHAYFSIPYLMTMIRYKSDYFTCLKLTPERFRMPPLLLHINWNKANRELHL